MRCPFDGSDLEVVNRSGIEIDWCPSCKGVWLERGELDKLIDRAAPDRGSERSMAIHDARARDDRPYPKKRKSVLSEIFDF